jgi:hypothetical protein
MTTARDLTEAQFIIAAKRQGFTHDFFGYWKLATPHDNTSVYRFNAGHRRRTQLAYLMAQQENAEAGRSINAATAQLSLNL